MLVSLEWQDQALTELTGVASRSTVDHTATVGDRIDYNRRCFKRERDK